jgi:hypothetical protein
MGVAKHGEDNSHDNTLVIDLSAPAEKNGDFDFSKGEISFYYARVPGWVSHDTPQTPIVLHMADVENLWHLWQEVISSTGRKSPVWGMNTGKLSDIIRKTGMADDFCVARGSRASQVLGRQGRRLLKRFKTDLESSLDEYLPVCKSDKISFRSLLRHAHYVRASDAARTPENPYGIILPEEEHLGNLRKAFEEYKKETALLFNELINHTAVSAKLKRGTIYHASRGLHATLEKGAMALKPLTEMSLLRSSAFPFSFNRSADIHLFTSRLCSEKKTIEQLSAGVSDNDLRRAAEWRLFDWLVAALTAKKALYLASFKKGLKKILDISGESS